MDYAEFNIGWVKPYMGTYEILSCYGIELRLLASLKVYRVIRRFPMLPTLSPS